MQHLQLMMHNSPINRHTMQLMKIIVPKTGAYAGGDLPKRDVNKSIKAHERRPASDDHSYSTGFGLKEKNSGMLWHTQIACELPGAGQEGQKVIAHPLGPDHPLGGTPNDDFAEGRRKVLNDLTGGNYICGHLLNHHLGGPGIRENLTAIPMSANGKQESEIENPVKNMVNNNLNWVHFELEVEYGERTVAQINPSWPASQVPDGWGQQSGQLFSTSAKVPYAKALDASWYCFDDQGKGMKETAKTVTIDPPSRSGPTGTVSAPRFRTVDNTATKTAATADVPIGFRPLFFPTQGEKPNLIRALPGSKEKVFPYAATGSNHQQIRAAVIQDIQTVTPFKGDLDTPELKARLALELNKKVHGTANPALLTKIGNEFLEYIETNGIRGEATEQINQLGVIETYCRRWTNLVNELLVPGHHLGNIPLRPTVEDLIDHWDKCFADLTHQKEPSKFDDLRRQVDGLPGEIKRKIYLYRRLRDDALEKRKEARSQQKRAAEQIERQQKRARTEQQEANQKTERYILNRISFRKTPTNAATSNQSDMNVESGEQ